MGEVICALHILRVLCAVAVAEGVEILLSNNKVWSELCSDNHVSPLSECICTITNWVKFTLYSSQIQVPFLEARMNPHALLQFAVESSETRQGFEEADSPTKFSAAMAYLSPSLVSLGSLSSFFMSDASDLLVEHSMFADC